MPIFILIVFCKEFFFLKVTTALILIIHRNLQWLLDQTGKMAKSASKEEDWVETRLPPIKQ